MFDYEKNCLNCHRCNSVPKDILILKCGHKLCPECLNCYNNFNKNSTINNSNSNTTNFQCAICNTLLNFSVLKITSLSSDPTTKKNIFSNNIFKDEVSNSDYISKHNSQKSPCNFHTRKYENTINITEKTNDQSFNVNKNKYSGHKRNYSELNQHEVYNIEYNGVLGDFKNIFTENNMNIDNIEKADFNYYSESKKKYKR